MFGFSLWACLTETIISGYNLQLCLTEVVMPSNRASSDAGPKLAGRESHEAMESPEALIAPLKGGWGIKTSARSVRVWDRVPMKNNG